MRVLAIDPGTTESAAVDYHTESGDIFDAEIMPNEKLVELLGMNRGIDHLAVEMVASYGMPVGETTFETVLWIGRFIEAFRGPHTKVYRNRKGECESVKMHICKSNKAKDGNIRQALIDRFPRTGGGKTPQIGTKSKPGPLYGFADHKWAALAVAITFAETYKPAATEPA